MGGALEQKAFSLGRERARDPTRCFSPATVRRAFLCIASPRPDDGELVFDDFAPLLFARGEKTCIHAKHHMFVGRPSTQHRMALENHAAHPDRAGRSARPKIFRRRNFISPASIETPWFAAAGMPMSVTGSNVSGCSGESLTMTASPFASSKSRSSRFLRNCSHDLHGFFLHFIFAIWRVYAAKACCADFQIFRSMSGKSIAVRPGPAPRRGG